MVIRKRQPRASRNTGNTARQKNAEGMLSKIIDGSPIPSFVINEQRKVTHWNTAMESLTGIKRHDIIGTDGQWRAFYLEKRPTMADLIVDGASADKIEEYYRGKCRKSSLIEGACEAEDFFPSLGENGKWLHFTASPIRKRHGKIISAIETLQDITEQKKAEVALAESERSFRDLFESALDAIWVHDFNGNIQVANLAAAKLTDYPLEGLRQANVSSFLTPESLELIEAVQTRLIDQEPVDIPYLLRLLRRDGTELIVEVTTRLMAHDEQPVSFQNIARDVTRERKMHESMHFYLQKVLVAQEEERKRISRELHDDTAQSLLLLIQKLDAEISDRKNRLSKPVKERLATLNALAVEILGGIRRYAQELRPAILDDLGFIAALEWMADKLIAENGINATVRHDGLKCQLSREVGLVLFRIAQEAISNIQKYSRASAVTISLESEGSQMRMTIADDGRGFEVPARLSDFSRAGKLGIIGMQERAQLLHGTISIQSESGKGTFIIVEIPLDER